MCIRRVSLYPACPAAAAVIAVAVAERVTTCLRCPVLHKGSDQDCTKRFQAQVKVSQLHRTRNKSGQMRSLPSNSLTVYKPTRNNPLQHGSHPNPYRLLINRKLEPYTPVMDTDQISSETIRCRSEPSPTNDGSKLIGSSRRTFSGGFKTFPISACASHTLFLEGFRISALCNGRDRECLGKGQFSAKMIKLVSEKRKKSRNKIRIGLEILPIYTPGKIDFSKISRICLENSNFIEKLAREGEGISAAKTGTRSKHGEMRSYAQKETRRHPSIGARLEITRAREQNRYTSSRKDTSSLPITSPEANPILPWSIDALVRHTHIYIYTQKLGGSDEPSTHVAIREPTPRTSRL